VDATILGDLPDAPDPESAQIVARAEARSSDVGCPEGLVSLDATVYERRRDAQSRELVLVTEYDVVTGEANCSTGWGKAGIAAFHDWGVGTLPANGRVRQPQSDVVPAGGDDPKRATLEEAHTAKTTEWRVHFTPPNESSATFHFASAYRGVGTPSDGDLLVRTRSETRVRQGWIGGRDVLRTGAELVYGDTSR
jgi:hypothetical protein